MKHDVESNSKLFKSNKSSSVTKDNRTRTNSPYIKHQSYFESEEYNSKLAQVVTIIESSVLGYDDLQIIYTTQQSQACTQIKLVKPRFIKRYDSDRYEQYLRPLEQLGVVVVRDVVEQTYIYNVV
jgi:hypothetical protein